MKRILLVHPILEPPGGAEGLAACFIQGLLASGRFQLTLATIRPPDFDGLNLYFGTQLSASDPSLKVVVLPTARRFIGLIRLAGFRAALLESGLLSRRIRDVAKRFGPFNLYLSTENERSFPSDASALQYIHYPAYHPVRGVGDYRWFHRLPGVLAAYRFAANRLAGADLRQIRLNHTLANSKFSATAYQEAHGATAQVIHPPVPGQAPEPSNWASRENRIVALGRLAKEKEIPTVISIVGNLREALAAAGTAPDQLPCLDLVGGWDCRGSLRRKIEALLDRHSAWIRLHQGVPRASLDRFLADSRYGIHVMPDEHFGMGVAEMQRAGCVCFVPDTGGPKEIIGEDESRQIFSSPADAVNKMADVLSDSNLQTSLHQRALGRRDLFSTQRFVDACVRHVDAALAVAE